MAEIIGRRPLSKKDDLKRLLESTRRYYELFSDEYVEFYENWRSGLGAFSNSEYRRGYDRVAEILKEIVRYNQLILDLGCGVGTWSILMAEAGANVIGIDYSREALLKYKEYSKKSGVEHKVSEVLSDGFYLPFMGETYDGLTLNWVLAHIPHNYSGSFLLEVARVLKTGGWVMVSDSYWRGQEGGREQVQTRRSRMGTFHVYKYYYTPEELESLLKNTLGEVLQTETTPYEMLCIARKKQPRTF